MADSPLPYDGALTLALNVKDRTASAAWYTKHLGFEVLYDAPEIGWCELNSPYAGVTVGLADNEDIRIGGPVPTLGVSDIDAARNRLEGGGVSFDGPTVTVEGMVKFTTFYDPDGHAWMLAETLMNPEEG